MPERVDAAAVCARVGGLASSLHRTAWVGIDGFSAAGKSTLAERIAAAVPSVAVIGIDGFATPSVAEWDWLRFHEQVVAPLRDGRSARYQVWGWDAAVGGRWHEVEPGGVVVVEGVSCTREEAGVPWDLTVWVDAPFEVRHERVVLRDDATTQQRWLKDWVPSEQAWAARERPQETRDYVVDGR